MVDLRRAEDLIEQVLAVSPNSANAHFAKGELLRAQSRPEHAIFEYEAVIALDHNFAAAYCYLAACKLLAGWVDDVIPLEEHAMRLDPRTPAIGSRYFYIGAAHLLRSRLDEAILWLEKPRSVYGWFHPVHAGLAAAYALNGEIDRAVAALGEARNLSDRYSSISRLKAWPGRQWLEVPKLRAAAEPTYFAGCERPGCRRNDRRYRLRHFSATVLSRRSPLPRVRNKARLSLAAPAINESRYGRGFNQSGEKP
jgi:tetratricopeptide (TPR) repeat protein